MDWLRYSNPAPIGLCYPWALKKAQEIKKAGGDPRIVHGRVHHRHSGERFMHGWVEWDGMVFDERQPEGIPLDDYERILRPERHEVYEVEEAELACLQVRKHGPWTPEEAERARASVRRLRNPRKRIATLWRNKEDTIRVRLFDRADYTDIFPRGKYFDADVFYRGSSEVMTASVEGGDYFYSRQEALDWIETVIPEPVPMRLPRGANTWTHGWD